MRKRYPLRGALGRGDSGDARDLQGIALGRFQATHLGQSPAGDADEPVRYCGPRRRRLRRDVHHGYLAALPVMRQLGLQSALRHLARSLLAGPTEAPGAGEPPPILRSPIRAFSAAQPESNWPPPEPPYRRNPATAPRLRSARLPPS